MTTTDQARASVVLVHAAWADASSWNKIIPLLQMQGIQVAVALNQSRNWTVSLRASPRGRGWKQLSLRSPALMVACSPSLRGSNNQPNFRILLGKILYSRAVMISFRHYVEVSCQVFTGFITSIGMLSVA